MSLFTDLRTWLEANPPEDMPYWPGARTTGRFGLRSLQMLLDIGASPLHPGVDRASGGQFTVPFDARIFWRRLHPNSAWGSVLIVKAVTLDLELHVGHTCCPDEPVMEFDGFYKRGHQMPVDPGSLGLSTAVHTHTEVVMPLDNDVRCWIMNAGCDTILTPEGELAEEYVRDFCREHDLNYEQVEDMVWRQVGSWGIEEMTTKYMVRKRLPPHRRPTWGHGDVMLIDSHWLLQI